ncbi:MAG TPA: alpha-isopropylmalate synthase regulatory domain-containing protein, partial [Lachnospiraceae bacterium]|nr:alpha-isopropylmalate synthase regulatory domain-containing protein [Lachnospiraceae bacterium]
KKCKIEDISDNDTDYDTMVTLHFTVNGVEKTVETRGNGPIDAVQRAMQNELGIKIKVLDYSEHALREGSNAQAAAYIHMLDQVTNKATFGVGVSSNITRASIRGIFSAINRLIG